MEFLEGVGQRYLERKAYAVPQQLENLAKRQLAAAAAETKPIVQASTTLPAFTDKDHEIQTLRNELADAKAERQNRSRKTIGTFSTRDLSTEMKTSKQPEKRRLSMVESERTELLRKPANERRHNAASSQTARDKHAAITRSSSEMPSVENSMPRAVVAQHDETPTRREPPKVTSTNVQIQSSARREHLSDRRKPDVCAVYVEEEVPRRRRLSTKDVVEVSSSQGRTIYRVR